MAQNMAAQIVHGTPDYSCPPNSDKLYDRKAVYSEIAALLEGSIPEYKRSFPAGFGVMGDSPRAFFVFDLSDASNNKVNGWRCVKLINNHIYHVAPTWAGFSFSHIIILEDGKLRVFKSINCRGRGDSLPTVLTYLRVKLENNKDRTEILDRVVRYRDYGIYWAIDNRTLACDDVNEP